MGDEKNQLPNKWNSICGGESIGHAGAFACENAHKFGLKNSVMQREGGKKSALKQFTRAHFS